MIDFNNYKADNGIYHCQLISVCTGTSSMVCPNVDAVSPDFSWCVRTQFLKLECCSRSDIMGAV